MLKYWMKRKLRAFGKSFGYDTRYSEELIDGDVAAGFALGRLSAAADYQGDAPPAAWYAAKIVAAMSEDCGPCVQLAVTMAERAGIAATDLRAIVAGDVAAMSAEAALGYRFAKAVLAKSVEMDDLRQQILDRWGGKTLGALAMIIATTRAFPVLKTALGHGQSCQSVEVGGIVIAPAKHAYA